MMAQPVKRPLDQQDDHLDVDYKLDYLSAYPTNDIVTNPFCFNNYDPFAHTSAVPNNSLYAIPEVSTANFPSAFQSSGFALDPLAAYSTTTGPLATFDSDFKADTSSLATGFPGFGPATSQFMYLDETFQSYTSQAPAHSATMNSSFQTHHNQRRKSRSNTSMDGPSIHGRSVGSEYFIDSPYDGGQGSVMTPGTAQSFEFVDRFPEPDHSSHGLLAHENDLIGIINQSPLRTTGDFSRSPQEISLEGIDPDSVAPTFTLNGYNDRFPDPNPDPWVPFSLGPSTTNLEDAWDNQYNYFPPSNMGFPPQQSHSPVRTHQYVNSDYPEESSSSREPSRPSSAQATINKSAGPINLPPSTTLPNKIKRKAAGRRKGPLREEQRKNIKSTREAHACWCCKMRKVECNADTTDDCPKCQTFWQYKMTGPFLNKPLCIRTSLEDLEGVFIPEFMVEQFNHTRVNSLMNDLVQENGWLDRGKTDIRLLCGFGPPLIVRDIQEFRPNGVVKGFSWRRNHPNTVEGVKCLPLGISQPDFWAESNVLNDFDQHLNAVTLNRDDLNEFADRVLRSHGHNRSSRTLKAVLQWYYEWKDPESMSKEAEVLLRNAIKVIMITVIFGRKLIMQDIPRPYEKFFSEAPYTSQNYSRQRQSPRLINRQVKAALRVLQQKLLSRVLKDFGQQLARADGWPICFTVAIILAFSLEHTREKSVGQYRLTKACGRLDKESARFSGSEEVVHEYRTVALVRVFDIIHVLMRCKSDKQVSSKGKRTKRMSSMGSTLIQILSDLKYKFDDEENDEIQQAQTGLQVGEEPCRLVSALLELIQ